MHELVDVWGGYPSCLCHIKESFSHADILIDKREVSARLVLASYGKIRLFSRILETFPCSRAIVGNATTFGIVGGAAPEPLKAIEAIWGKNRTAHMCLHR